MKLLKHMLMLLLLIGCNNQENKEEVDDDYERQSFLGFEDQYEKDLAEIKKDGYLNVLVVYSSTSYFIYRGQPLGFEYELLKRLAKHLDVKLKIKVAKDIDKNFELLNDGEVDLIAHGTTITNKRKRKVAFTDYLYLVHQVLVQRKPENWRNLSWSETQKHLIHDAVELIDDTVSVRKGSSYYNRLKNLSNELGGKIHINELDGSLSTDEIIQLVVDGKVKYTVADNNLAKINASYYPELNIDVPLSFSQRIGWAVRRNSPQLLAAINKWIAEERNETDYYVIYNKYFKNKRKFRRRIKSEYYSKNSNEISKYDGIIKKYATFLQWDWRFLASQIYQESRFKVGAKSWAGAKGLMQIMPRTAESLGITNPADPQQSIKGGTNYLKTLFSRFKDIPDSLTRVKFTLAAYNCGYQHVRDAQRLAEVKKIDPTLWKGAIDSMLLALSHPQNYNHEQVQYGYVRGIEPVTYVEQIFERYDHYKNIVKN